MSQGPGDQTGEATRCAARAVWRVAVFSSRHHCSSFGSGNRKQVDSGPRLSGKETLGVLALRVEPDLHSNSLSCPRPLDRSGRGRVGQLPDADAQAGGAAAPAVQLLTQQEDARVGPLPQVQHLREQLHQDHVRDLPGAVRLRGRGSTPRAGRGRPGGRSSASISR